MINWLNLLIWYFMGTMCSQQYFLSILIWWKFWKGPGEKNRARDLPTFFQNSIHDTTAATKIIPQDNQPACCEKQYTS